MAIICFSLMVLQPFLCLLCRLVLVFLFAIRLYKPLYRLTNELNNADSLKDVRNIQPRKGDFFQEVFEAVDRKIKSVNEKK